MLVSFGFFALPPAPAEARCIITGTYCIHEHRDYNGEACVWKGSVPNYLGQTSLNGFSCNDMASSWTNNGTGPIRCLVSFMHANYSVRMWEAYGDHMKSDWVGDEHNDKASSHQWVRC